MLLAALLCSVLLTASVAAAPDDTPTAARRQDPPAPAEATLPISGGQRARWFARSTVGPRSLAVGVWSAGWGTALDKPEEYGRDAAGFGKRYAVRLSGIAVGNGIEAGLGALWGEDPRYFRAAAGTPGGRVRHALTMTVMAQRANGRLSPAYARYTGIVGNNLLSNAWRVESASSVPDALSRSALGFTGKLVSNLFEEFWPDIRRRVFRKQASNAADLMQAPAPPDLSGAAKHPDVQ